MKLSENPYYHIYQELNIKVSPQIKIEQAENIVRHLGYMHNTFGLMIKDFVKLLSFQFKTQTIDLKHAQKEDDKTKGKPKEEEKSQEVKQNTLKQTKENTFTEKAQENLSIFDEFQFNNSQPKYNKRTVKDLTKRITTKDFQNYKTEKARINIIKQKNSFDIQFNQARQQEVMQIEDQSLNQLINPQLKDKIQQPSQNESENLSNLNIIHIQDSDMSSNQEKSRIFGNNKPKNNKKKNGNAQFESYIKSEDERKKLTKNQQKMYQDPSVRVNAGRKKKQRSEFSGISCPDCDKFYDALGVKGDDPCKCVSRHKSNLPMRKQKNDMFSQQFRF